VNFIKWRRCSLSEVNGGTLRAESWSTALKQTYPERSSYIGGNGAWPLYGLAQDPCVCDVSHEQ